ncbi:hypothetical protein AB836_00190 [Rickettsiales bacterium (ex Bugula neritina AB1)]|nr:hypothetical protein AB836_00190 [Rickettsiales bacterium (ex Bugula neritina AB1)]
MRIKNFLRIIQIISIIISVMLSFFSCYYSLVYLKCFPVGIIFFLFVAILFFFLSIVIKNLVEIITFRENNNQELEAERISNIIQEGAFSYLKNQYKIVLIISSGIAIILYKFSLSLCIGFLLSIFFMIISSLYSTFISTTTNVVLTVAAKTSSSLAFDKGFKGASSGSNFTVIMILSEIIIIIFLSSIKIYVGLFSLFDLIIGAVLGASTMCIFNRLGGGVFTKAADVAGDIVGKIEKSLPEDSPKNPAVIADNVGDNVGDCIGANSDIFESYLSTFLVGMFLHISSGNEFIIVFSVYIIISISGLISSLISDFILGFTKDIWQKIKLYFFSSIIINFIISSVLIFFLRSSVGVNISFCMYRRIVLCIFIGMMGILSIIKIIEYFTSDENAPIKELANASQFGDGNNIIYGFALGFFSTSSILSVIIVMFLLADLLLGVNGIAFMTISIISLSSTIIKLDLLGPTIDNGGGIAEMSNMHESVRKNTDFLDVIGNTTKAVTKGFSSSVATLTSILLLMLYNNLKLNNNIPFNNTCLSSPMIFLGLLLGSVIVLIFSGLGMKSVGDAAQKVVEKIRLQFHNNPKILEGEELPDYNETITYLTNVSCKKMYTQIIYPILILIMSVLINITINRFIIKIISTKDFLAAISIGVTIVSTCYGLFMTITGAAWDNCKKYIEKGHYGGKKSSTHKAAITGDTVGDPFKDTVGPSLGSLGKFINIFAIILIILFRNIL